MHGASNLTPLEAIPLDYLYGVESLDAPGESYFGSCERQDRSGNSPGNSGVKDSPPAHRG